MRRFRWIVLILVLVLAACGGPPPDTTVPAPPDATVFESSDNAQINQYIERLKTQVPVTMKEHGIQETAEKPIEQQLYRSTASLEQIAESYAKLTERGWVRANKMPLLQNGVLIDGYEIGSTTLVINAIEESKLGGESGVLIYTVKGSK